MKLTICTNTSVGALQPCCTGDGQSSLPAAGHPALGSALLGGPGMVPPRQGAVSFPATALHCCPGMGGGRTMLRILCCCTPFSGHRGIVTGHGVRLPSEQMPKASGHA